MSEDVVTVERNLSLGTDNASLIDGFCNAFESAMSDKWPSQTMRREIEFVNHTPYSVVVGIRGISRASLIRGGVSFNAQLDALAEYDAERTEELARRMARALDEHIKETDSRLGYN